MSEVWVGLLLYVNYLLSFGLLMILLLLGMAIFMLSHSGENKSKMVLKLVFKLSFVIMLANCMYMLSFSSGLSLVCFKGTSFLMWGGLGISLSLKSVSFMMVSFLVSWSILGFGVDYMVEDKGKVLFLVYLCMFILFMMILILADNMLFFFVGWESVSVMSYVLISWWFSRAKASSSSLQAIMLNRVSDFSVLGFMSVLMLSGVDLSLGGLTGDFPGAVTLLFFLSVVSKSAQFLFHPWLPNAMEGPTPVSSLLHSSTMVVASVYLMMRMMTFMSSGTYMFVFSVSVVTSLLSSFLAMGQMDMKKIIAYSTTSQLSFMMLGLSLGLEKLVLGYLLVHAFFKALIFMLSSILIHGAMNNQDLRGNSLGGKWNKLVVCAMFLGSIVMMGYPFLAGFWVKDLIIENVMSGSLNRMLILLSVLSLGTTSVYSVRLNVVLVNFWWASSGSKMLGMEGLATLMSFFRLMILSVSGSFLVWAYLSPHEEELFTLSIKLLPLMILFLSSFFGMMSLKGFWGGILHTGDFCLMFNPLINKLSSVVYKVSESLLKIDLVMLEMLLPRLSLKN